MDLVQSLEHGVKSKFLYLMLPSPCSTGGVTFNGYQCSAYGWQAVNSDPDGTFHSGCANPDSDPKGSWCSLVRGTTTALGLTWDYCQPACTNSTGGWEVAVVRTSFIPVAHILSWLQLQDVVRSVLEYSRPAPTSYGVGYTLCNGMEALRGCLDCFLQGSSHCTCISNFYHTLSCVAFLKRITQPFDFASVDVTQDWLKSLYSC